MTCVVLMRVKEVPGSWVVKMMTPKGHDFWVQLGVHSTSSLLLILEHKMKIGDQCWISFLEFLIPYFPAGGPALKRPPGLEWAPGQKRTLWSPALKKKSLKWALWHRNIELSERLEIRCLFIILCWWRGEMAVTIWCCTLIRWDICYTLCELVYFRCSSGRY